MGLFSKCEKTPRWRRFKTLLLAILVTLAAAAFFVPPEFCKLYIALCEEFEYLQHFDKVFHFMFFTGITISIPLTKNIFGKILIFIALLALGIGIEAIQYYTLHRGASLNDLLANILGIVFGLTLRSLRANRKGYRQ